jgi:hypothetical protein
MRVGRGVGRVEIVRLTSVARVAAEQVRNASAAGNSCALESFLRTFVSHLQAGPGDAPASAAAVNPHRPPRRTP